MRRALRVVPVFVLAFVACRANDFDPASKVESVRILATRADRPYAKPGETVSLEVLAVDGRTDQAARAERPMNVYWVPVPCVNPPGDSYYACYPAFAAFPRDTDLAPLLRAGRQYDLTMPPDVITNHSKQGGAVDVVPDGLVVVFTIACAGHVEYVPPRDGVPNSLPLGCFDADRHALSPNDYVFSFSLVYAFDDRPNANPNVDAMTFAGASVNPATGITLDHGASAAVDIHVTDDSWELDPSNPDRDGQPRKEAIRVQWFATGASLNHDLINLFDPTTGRISGTGDVLSAPATAGEETLWAVVRDNRGGATWLTVPLHIR